MAIPFLAKDIPVVDSEFCHVDVAILLTLLSNYYTGISDEQVSEAIDCVANEQKPKWI